MHANLTHCALLRVAIPETQPSAPMWACTRARRHVSNHQSQMLWMSCGVDWALCLNVTHQTETIENKHMLYTQYVVFATILTKTWSHDLHNSWAKVKPFKNKLKIYNWWPGIFWQFYFKSIETYKIQVSSTCMEDILVTIHNGKIWNDNDDVYYPNLVALMGTMGTFPKIFFKNIKLSPQTSCSSQCAIFQHRCGNFRPMARAFFTQWATFTQENSRQLLTLWRHLGN